MHVKSISKIPTHGYVNKQIKLKCEYNMKVYGYNPLDNPPQKCDNVSRLKGRISPMTYAHSRSGSSTSDWQTLLDCYKVDERRECLMSHVSCHSSSSHVSRLNPLKFNPLFKSSPTMKNIIAISPRVWYNTRCHDKKRLFSKGRIKLCELKHSRG